MGIKFYDKFLTSFMHVQLVRQWLKLAQEYITERVSNSHMVSIPVIWIG